MSIFSKIGEKFNKLFKNNADKPHEKDISAPASGTKTVIENRNESSNSSKIKQEDQKYLNAFIIDETNAQYKDILESGKFISTEEFIKQMGSFDFNNPTLPSEKNISAQKSNNKQMDTPYGVLSNEREDQNLPAGKESINPPSTASTLESSLKIQHYDSFSKVSELGNSVKIRHYDSLPKVSELGNSVKIQHYDSFSKVSEPSVTESNNKPLNKLDPENFKQQGNKKDVPRER